MLDDLALIYFFLHALDCSLMSVVGSRWVQCSKQWQCDDSQWLQQSTDDETSQPFEKHIEQLL